MGGVPHVPAGYRYTLNPNHQTLNPTPETPNPKPHTLSPKPGTNCDALANYSFASPEVEELYSSANGSP